MTVERRYSEDYPRPNLPIRQIKMTSAMSTDRDYVLISQSMVTGGWEISAVAHKDAGTSYEAAFHFKLPVGREDLEQLIVAVRDILDERKVATLR